MRIRGVARERARASSPRRLPSQADERPRYVRPLRVIVRIVNDYCAECDGTTMWTQFTASRGRGDQTAEPPEACDHCGESSAITRRTAGVIWAAGGRAVLVRGDPNAW